MSPGQLVRADMDVLQSLMNPIAIRAPDEYFELVRSQRCLLGSLFEYSVHRQSMKSTAEGAREKDGIAKELSFFIRGEVMDDGDGQGKEERVFVHPSSGLFNVGNFSWPWLVYNSIVKTSKPFLRDATECSAYALLLFGGDLDVEARKSVISIDGWVKLSVNTRIKSLVRGLRAKMDDLDDLLTEKIKDPTFDISGTSTMRLIVTLLLSDGMGC